MSSKHTDGPWVLDGHNMSSIIRCTVPRGHPDAKHTCGDYETIADCKGDNWKANARLIAAAPELLEAAICALGQLTGNMDGNADLGEPREMLRAAIAKAEGKP